MASKRIISPAGTLAFPSLFEARANPNNPSAKPKFETTIVFPEGTDISALEAIVEEAMQDKWGADRPGNVRSPFRNAGEKSHLGEPFVEGATCITVKSQFGPGVVDAESPPQPILNQSEIYPGVIARVQLHAFAYSASGNNGVSFGLDNVQKLKDGTPVGGRNDAGAAFDGVSVDDLL